MTRSIDLGWIPLSGSLQGKLDLYASLLLEWNKKIRLTGFSTPDEVRRHLILDSLLAFELLHERLPAEIIDFGSGNGTPGLLFAILAPNHRITLLERIEKKRIFIEYAASRLGLSNTRTLPSLSCPIISPFILMKAITLDDLFSDPAIRKNTVPPCNLFRFGHDSHSACIPVSSYAITGGVHSWGETKTISLTESIFQG